MTPPYSRRTRGTGRRQREVAEKEVKTIKLDNLVPPIHFRLGEVEIPEEYLKLLRERARQHARSRQCAAPLCRSCRFPAAQRPAESNIYGDNIGLSRERAGTVAEYCQRALDLPPEAISYEGLGDSQPVASNATEEGRQLNRRVEVEVWYDEIGEKLVEKEVIVPQRE